MADCFGLHDLAYWLIFVAVMCAWFLFLFAPQHERLDMLASRRHVLNAHLAAEKNELQRLHLGIDDLLRGNPHAWERAARTRLGWLEPGELTDLKAWSRIQELNLSKPSAKPSGTSPALLHREKEKISPAIRSSLPANNRSGISFLNGTDAIGAAIGAPPSLPSSGIDTVKPASALKLAPASAASVLRTRSH